MFEKLADGAMAKNQTSTRNLKGRRIAQRINSVLKRLSHIVSEFMFVRFFILFFILKGCLTKRRSNLMHSPCHRRSQDWGGGGAQTTNHMQ